MLRLPGPELWSSHLGEIDRREWGALVLRLRERVRANQLPDLLVTFEDPRVRGWLVGSLIMRDDAAEESETVETAIVGALAEVGVPLHVQIEHPGVWVGDRRIGWIGAHQRFGINVDGQAPDGITSLQRETGRELGVHEVRSVLTACVAGTRARTKVDVAPEWLGRRGRR